MRKLDQNKLQSKMYTKHKYKVEYQLWLQMYEVGYSLL